MNFRDNQVATLTKKSETRLKKIRVPVSKSLKLLDQRQIKIELAIFKNTYQKRSGIMFISEMARPIRNPRRSKLKWRNIFIDL